MLHTLRRMREKRIGGDQGFTLIELLVVVVIIGVLVAIAIPVYLNYRKGAENKSAMSDVRSAVSAVEQCYADNKNAYPANAGPAVGPAPMVLTCNAVAANVNVSVGNTMNYAQVLLPALHYSITVKNADTGKTYTYDSSTGQIT